MDIESLKIIDVLRNLKREGVKYNYIASCCDIAPSSFYQYMREGKFPLLQRRRIEEFLKTNFSEVYF